MTERDNFLKAVHFDNPDYTPAVFAINKSCWHSYDQNILKQLIVEHKLLFPDYNCTDVFVEPDYYPWHKNKPFIDDWGCVWKTTDDGITGTVVEHPLKNLEAINTFAVPSPAQSNGLMPIDWDIEAANLDNQRQQGKPVIGGLRHGHTFLQLCDLMGYENLLFDMFDENPNLWRLIEVLEEFNLGIIERYAKLKPDVMVYPEDLGMQVGPMLSPEQFRKFIKPSYKKLIKPAREAGCCIHMHSDGDIKTLAADLIEGGVEILNLQDTANGIEWIKDNLKGKVCLDIDIDRQNITRFGTEKEIFEHIGEIKKQLSSPQGGLMMIYGLYPGLPPENIKAVMDAMEFFCF